MKNIIFISILLLLSFFVKAQNGEIYYQELDTTFHSPEDYPGGIGFTFCEIDFDNDNIYDFNFGTVFMDNPSLPDYYGLAFGLHHNPQHDSIYWNACLPPPSPTVGDTVSKLFRNNTSQYYIWYNQPTPLSSVTTIYYFKGMTK